MHNFQLSCYGGVFINAFKTVVNIQPMEGAAPVKQSKPSFQKLAKELEEELVSILLL
jgi:hypothetical protein